MNRQEGSAQPCSVMNSPVNDFVLVKKLEAEEHTGRVEPENKERGNMNHNWRSSAAIRGQMQTEPVSL